MTQHKVEIKADDQVGLKNWMDCAAAMRDELRALNSRTVDNIMDKYEFRRCNYGMGLNIDWPEK